MADQVNIPVKELITMVATEVAGKFVDSLMEKEIKPMKTRLDSIEEKMTVSSTRTKTALDTLWKVAVIVAGLVSIITKIEPGWFK